MLLFLMIVNGGGAGGEGNQGGRLHQRRRSFLNVWKTLTGFLSEGLLAGVDEREDGAASYHSGRQKRSNTRKSC